MMTPLALVKPAWNESTTNGVLFWSVRPYHTPSGMRSVGAPKGYIVASVVASSSWVTSSAS